MRIISGLARGKKLISPPVRSNFIRPTSDRAREALFSIIGNHVVDSIVLDLFAGTGAFGLEALSRGARHVFFVDNQPVALSIIAENIKNCFLQTTDLKLNKYNHLTENQYNDDKQPPSATILKRDLTKKLYLKEIHFNLIFIDPPYTKGLALPCLKNIEQSAFIAQNALIIVEENSSVSLPKSFSGLKLKDQRQYGDSAFWFYRKIEN